MLQPVHKRTKPNYRRLLNLETLMHTLTPRQRAAALHLAAGKTGRQAASIVGVTPQTLSDWCQSTHFKAHVEVLLMKADDLTCIQLCALRHKAVDRLLELLASNSPAVALRSVELALKVSSTSNMKARDVDLQWTAALEAVERANGHEGIH